MGSGSSKEKAALSSQLDELNPKYKAAVQTIILRENQINEKQKELETAQREAAETQGLKERVSELEKQISSLREEKQREVNRLQDELSRELSGQLRVAESLTQERNLARKEVGQLKEKLTSIEGGHADAIQKLEDAGRTSTAESDAKRGELEKQAMARAKDLSSMKSELDMLKTEKLRLEESERAAGEELTTAKGDISAGEKERERLSGQLEETRRKLEESEKARDELTQGSRTVNDELAAAKAAADGEVRKQEDLAEQLASTQNHLAHLEASRDTLQKQNNEGISKRSALHEAFQATKIELSEWVEGYKKLQGEKRTVDEKVKILEEQASASTGSGEELKRVKKELSESGDRFVVLQGEHEGLKRSAAEAESGRGDLQRELEEAKKSTTEGEQSQQTLKDELEAAKKQGADAEESSKKRSEEHQAEIEELRKALREAKESQPKADVASVEAPKANGVSNGVDLEALKENGHAEAINGVKNGHVEKMEVNGETAVAQM